MSNVKQQHSKGKERVKYVDTTYGKIPANNIDAEMAVLGAMMLEVDGYGRVEGIILADSFYEEKHRLIFEAIENMYLRGSKVDLLTLADELLKTDSLDKAGGAYYLTSLTMNVVSSANIESHALIIQQCFIKRMMGTLSGMLYQAAYDHTVDALDLLDMAETEIFKLSQNNVPTSFINGAKLAKNFLDFLHMRQGTELMGFTSGFHCIDKLTAGFQGKCVYILAARPSVGKTAFAIALLLRMAKIGIPVALFSLETSELKITTRIIAALAEVEIERITKNTLTEQEKEKMANAAIELSKLPIYVIDIDSLNIQQFRSTARKLKQKHNVQFIAIDYLQLMEGRGTEGNREQVVANISRGIKRTAKELDIPIMPLSQLNRLADNQNPTLKDLRESGSIEQDADVVMFISRPDYQQDPNAQMKEGLQDDASIHFAKNKDGSTDYVFMKFVKPIQKWFDNEEYNSWVYGNLNKPLPQPFTSPDNPSAGIRQIYTNTSKPFNHDN